MIIHVYSFSLFVSSKTRYHAEFKYIESSLLFVSMACRFTFMLMTRSFIHLLLAMTPLI